MFIPVTDQNPLRRISRPYVTWGLIITNCLVYFWQTTLEGNAGMAAVLAGGLTPSQVLGLGSADTAALPPVVTLLTYMFLHADVLHLVGNMVFLFVFGDNIEDATGHVRFLIFFLLSGIAAGLAHALVEPGSTIPLIGASGATSGLVGAYLMLHPRVHIWVLVLGRVPLRLRAFWVIGAWFAWQVGFVLLGQNPNVAWWAHIGGFAAGCVLILFLRRPGIRLFDRDLAARA